MTFYEDINYGGRTLVFTDWDNGTVISGSPALMSRSDLKNYTMGSGLFPKKWNDNISSSKLTLTLCGYVTPYVVGCPPLTILPPGGSGSGGGPSGGGSGSGGGDDDDEGIFAIEL